VELSQYLVLVRYVGFSSDDVVAKRYWVVAVSANELTARPRRRRHRFQACVHLALCR